MTFSVYFSAHYRHQLDIQAPPSPKASFRSVKFRKLIVNLGVAPAGTSPVAQSLSRVVKPDADAVRYISKPDVAFLLSEIYDKEVYLQHGISLRPGDTVLDIGANIGLFAHYAAQHVGAAGRVIACEPIPPVYKAAEANVAALHTPGALSSLAAA
jgi:protein-L-isoaspartate O-methyltransferase